MPTLNWIGKDKVVNHHQAVPYRVLEHKYSFTAKDGKQKQESKSGNKIIHGDNLEALKSLLPEYEAGVDIVYIDPPYNTGKEKWRFTDNINHPKIQKWFNEIVGIEGEDLTRHDKWLCMMYPRVKLLHKLLKDDGLFFCSIDDYEQGNLKLMLDNIFGHQNFMNNIIWQRAFSPINTKKRFSPNHDFIIVYAKNKSLVELTLPRNNDADSRYANPDNDPRGLWTSSDLTVGPVIESKLFPIETPSGEIYIPPAGRCWVVSEKRYKEMLADNRIWFGDNGSNMPRSKRFLSEVKDGITPMTVWPYSEVGHTQDAKKEIKELFPESSFPFETPKPTLLMEKILSLKNNPDAIVLDSFAGTGSTAHAVLNLNKKDGGNRKFILVELEDYSEEITAARIKKVIKGYEFVGKKKRILSRYPINLTSLKKSDIIISELERYRNNERYSQVKIEEEDRKIAITAIESISGKTEGTGGGFSYYELGQPLFNSEGFLNEAIDEKNIREYIYYTETKQYLRSERPYEQKYLLDIYNDTAYYFYYEKDRLTTLSLDTLNIITEIAEQYIVYADNCHLDKEYMLAKNIIFKKIPRDIKKF